MKTRSSILTTKDRLTQYHDESWHTPEGRSIREVVFGMNDGLVTTIGFLAGVTGALREGRAILLVGIAEVIAGAISMGFGSFLANKAERDFFQSEIDRESHEIEQFPEREKDEIREIYADRGFSPEEVQMIVKRITSDKKLWLKFMAREELGIVSESLVNPYRAGIIIAASFIMGSIPPLLPYIFISRPVSALKWAIPLSMATLFGIGITKTRVAKGNIWKDGFLFLAMGSLAAALGYLLGTAFGDLLGL